MVKSSERRHSSIIMVYLYLLFILTLVVRVSPKAQKHWEEVMSLVRVKFNDWELPRKENGIPGRWNRLKSIES